MHNAKAWITTWLLTEWYFQWTGRTWAGSLINHHRYTTTSTTINYDYHCLRNEITELKIWLGLFHFMCYEGGGLQTNWPPSSPIIFLIFFKPAIPPKGGNMVFLIIMLIPPQNIKWDSPYHNWYKTEKRETN